MANGLRIGTEASTEFYVGVSAVDKVYLGASQVWPALVQTGRPTPVASYGPNGTHWHDSVPWIEDSFDYEVDADCDWADIKAKLDLCAARPTGDKCRVNVLPGTLVGNGAGAIETPTLQGVNHLSRDYPTIVQAKNGLGSVKFMTKGARLYNVHNVAFVYFMITQPSVWVLGQAQTRTAITAGNSTYLYFLRSQGRFSVTGNVDGPTNNIHFIECFLPNSIVQEDDSWAFRGAAETTGTISDIYMDGCYVAPSFRPNGSGVHTDTLQFSSDGAAYSDFYIRNTVLWSSTNQALQIGSAVNINLEKVFIVADFEMLKRFEVPDGANDSWSKNKDTGAYVGANGINGNGDPAGNHATDVIVIGDVFGTSRWATTDNAVMAFSDQPRLNEGVAPWTVDTSLQNKPVSYFDTMSPDLTPTYLVSKGYHIAS